MPEGNPRIATPPERRFLAALVGDWRGTARTWFKPGLLGDTSPVTASARPLLDGRFLLLSYEGTLDGNVMLGAAMLGYDSTDGWTMAWIDTAHNGTAMMHSVDDGTGGADLASVLGSYAPGAGVRWGWRTRISSPEQDRLIVLHRNVPPPDVSDEYDGVEFDLRRIASRP